MKKVALVSWVALAVIALASCSSWDRHEGASGTATGPRYDNQTAPDKAPASTTDR